MGPTGCCGTTSGDHDGVLLRWMGFPTPPIPLEQSTCFHGDKRWVPLYLEHFNGVKVKLFEVSELTEGVRSWCSLWSTMNPLCANRERQSANGLRMEGADDKGVSLNAKGIGLDNGNGRSSLPQDGRSKRGSELVSGPRFPPGSSIPSPVPKREGPGAPSAWFVKLTGTVMV
jgi:hypothetical protein